MNKKNYSYKTQEIDELKKEVISKLGKEILSHDVVIEFASLLSNKLSSQTIKRVFGLIEDGTNPSTYTLNIISSFIGYKNWQSFIKNKAQETVDDELDINKEKLNYFYEVISEDFWSNYYLNAKKQAQQTYKLINNTNDVELYRALAKNHNAQQNLFEFFPDFNTLTGNFRIGLTHYINFKKNNEAQIYGLSLLCLGSYLNEDRITFNKYYQNLSEIPEDYNIYPTVIGRRANIDIFYSLINNKDTVILEKKLSRLFKSCTWTVSIPNLQFITLEHLLLAQKHQLAYELLKNCELYQTSFMEYNSSKLYFQVLKIFEALILALNGELAKSKIIYQTIDISKLEFNFVEYYGCFYNWLQTFHISKSTALSNLEKRIEKTNYTLFRKLANHTDLL